MPLPVQTTAQSGALALGVSRDYWMAYERQEEAVRAGNMGRIVMDVEGKSDHWKGAYFGSAPIPRLWRRGEESSDQGFSDVGWTIVVDEWEQRVTWRWTDEQDDQTSSLPQRARNAGQSFWVRDESNFFQIMNAATDTAGLPRSVTGSDGASLFSATDGASAARFGVTGGNIVSGQSFASGAGVRQGLQSAISRMLQFQDTVGQPLYYDAKNFIVIGSAADLASHNEAFNQKLVAQAVTTATSNAGVTNVIMDAGYNVTLWLTQRVSTGRMYVFNTDVIVKPLIRVNRQAPEETPITMANSDLARRTGEVGIQWVARYGFGVGLPFGAVSVTT